MLAALAGGAALTKAELAAKAGCSAGVIDGLVADGALVAVALPPEPIAPLPDPDHAPRPLEPDQAAAAAELCEAVKARAFAPFLLEGVTGSGKTEVYFEAVAAALREGRQTLVMTPEIALTAQFLDRFAARFGVRPGEWHSGVTTRRRERLWGAVASGEAKVVVGARSALFLPFRDLGLIVVDEEHEGAYKQEDGVIYNARDMAVVRARLEKAPIVLASATPSIETRVNAEQGRYRWLKLAARFGARALPEIAAIDLRRAGPPRGRFLAPKLVEAVEATLAAGEQALLFLNRRGYAPLTLCRACGHRFQCPNCAAWLVEHRFRKALLCHHCGHSEPKPDACPRLPGGRHADPLRPRRRARRRGGGAAVSRRAPAGAVLRHRRRRRAAARGVERGRARRLRYRHRHPARRQGPRFSGADAGRRIVDADVGLANGDPRAAEHTFQLLRQATGRAGRGEKPGPGAVADLAARASRHRRAAVGRRRALL